MEKDKSRGDKGTEGSDKSGRKQVALCFKHLKTTEETGLCGQKSYFEN